MIFKVDPQSPKHKAIKNLIDRCFDANKQAGDLAEKLGSKKWRPKNFYLAGGISSFHFDEAPDGWKLAYPKANDPGYYPKANLKKNREALAKIEALPLILPSALNELIGFKSHFNHPGLDCINDVVILKFSDSWVTDSVDQGKPYQVPDYLTEITYSEYEEMKMKRKEAQS